MRHGSLPDSVMDLPTCSDRLAALGLDFGEHSVGTTPATARGAIRAEGTQSADWVAGFIGRSTQSQC